MPTLYSACTNTRPHRHCGLAARCGCLLIGASGLRLRACLDLEEAAATPDVGVVLCWAAAAACPLVITPAAAVWRLVVTPATAGTGVERRRLFSDFFPPTDMLSEEAAGCAGCSAGVTAVAVVDWWWKVPLCTGSPAADEVRRAGLGAAALPLCTLLPLASVVLGLAVALQLGRAVAMGLGAAAVAMGLRVAAVARGLRAAAVAMGLRAAAVARGLRAAAVAMGLRAAAMARGLRAAAVAMGLRAAAVARGLRAAAVAMGLCAAAVARGLRATAVAMGLRAAALARGLRAAALARGLRAAAVARGLRAAAVAMGLRAAAVARGLRAAAVAMGLRAAALAMGLRAAAVAMGLRAAALGLGLVTLTLLGVGPPSTAVVPAAAVAPLVDLTMAAVALLVWQAAPGDAGDSWEGGVAIAPGTGHRDLVEAVDSGLSSNSQLGSMFSSP